MPVNFCLFQTRILHKYYNSISIKGNDLVVKNSSEISCPQLIFLNFCPFKKYCLNSHSPFFKSEGDQDLKRMIS